MSNETKTDEIVAALQRRIVEGAYIPGQRLPGVRELAEEFHVSSPTIRAALNRLQAGNVVDIVPKSGVYVRLRGQRVTIGPMVPHHLKEKSGARLLTMLQDGNVETHTRSLKRCIVRPGPALLQKNLDEQTDYVHDTCLCLMQSVPYRIVDSYTARGSSEELFSTDVTDGLERIGCRMPQEQEAEMLQMSRNQPVFEIERWMFTHEGRVGEYTHIIANAALHELTYTYAAHTPQWDEYLLKKQLNA